MQKQCKTLLLTVVVFTEDLRTERVLILRKNTQTLAAAVGLRFTGPYLNPLVRVDAVQSDSGLWSVQENLQLVAFGVLTGANANGNHPTWTFLTCPIDK